MTNIISDCAFLQATISRSKSGVVVVTRWKWFVMLCHSDRKLCDYFHWYFDWSKKGPGWTAYTRRTILKMNTRLGRLSIERTSLFICDIQEIFRGRIFNYPSVMQGASTLLNVAATISIPVVVTTQYAERFGETVGEVGLNNFPERVYFKEDKTKFSMLSDSVFSRMVEQRTKSVILCGIEAHICILQTCLDLLEKGIDVHVVVDAVSSSRNLDRSVALERMHACGAHLTTLESVAFQLLQDSNHENFKAISKIIKRHNEVHNDFHSSKSKM